MDAQNIEQTKAELKRLQTRAKARTLEISDVDRVVEAYERGRELAVELTVDVATVEVTMTAEGVPSSYKHPADASTIYVRGGVLKVARVPARRQSGGAGAVFDVAMGWPSDKRVGADLPMHALTVGGAPIQGRKIGGKAVW